MNKDLEKDIKDADRYLSALNVSGDNVILLAQARMKLKDVYDQLATEHEYQFKEK